MSSSSNTDHHSTDLVIRHISNRGNVLITTKAIQCGNTIVIEEPTVIIPFKFGEYDTDTSSLTSVGIDPEIVYRFNYFLTLSPSKRKEILSFYCPLESIWSKKLRNIISESSIIEESNVEDFIKLATVLNFNSVAVNPQPLDGSTDTPICLGSGLFPLCCRMSHSCNPNCYWYSAQNGNRVVRCIRDIAFNEELTIDYLAEEEILQPTIIRQGILFRLYEFTCQCELCTEEGGDRLRQFNCMTHPTCLGTHKVYQDYTIDALPKFLPCNLCHTIASSSHQSKMLKIEQSTAEKLKKVDEELNQGFGLINFTLDDLLSMTKYSSQHVSSYHIALLKGELYYSPNPYHNKLKSLLERREAIQLMAAIINRPSRKLAFEYEKVGDLCVELQLFPEAVVNYQFSLRNLRIVLQDTEPFTLACAIKLQKHLVTSYNNKIINNISNGGKVNTNKNTNNNAITNNKNINNNSVHAKSEQHMSNTEETNTSSISSSSSHTSSCGFCADDTTNIIKSVRLLQCSRCNHENYCSSFCQKLHWKIHKQICQSSV